MWEFNFLRGNGEVLEGQKEQNLAFCRGDILEGRLEWDPSLHDLMGCVLFLCPHDAREHYGRLGGEEGETVSSQAFGVHSQACSPWSLTVPSALQACVGNRLREARTQAQPLPQ